MKYKISLAVLTLGISFFSLHSLAQSTDTIASGRPGVFIPPYVVGTGVLQVQTGLDYLKSEARFFTETTQSNNLFRLGLNEWFEANMLLNMQSDFVSNPNVSDRSGLSQVIPGIRLNLLNQKQGWVQGVGLQLDFSVKDVDSDYQRAHNTPGLTLISYHQLSVTYSITNNLGVSHDSFQGFECSYRTALGFLMTDELSGFIEVYGSFLDEISLDNDTTKLIYVDTGLAYIVGKDIQLDLSTGYGYNQGIAEVFVSTGASFRTHIF